MIDSNGYNIGGSGDVGVGVSDGDVGVGVSSRCNSYDTLYGHSRTICSIAFHPYEPIIASGSDDMTVRIWHIGTTIKCIRVLYGNVGRVCSIAFHSNGLYLATCSGYSSTKLYSIKKIVNSVPSIILVHISTFFVHGYVIRSLTFHPTLLILATGSCDGTIKLWSFNDDDNVIGNCFKTLYNHTSIICSVTFHPFLPIMASGSCDKTVRIWSFNDDCSNVNYNDIIHKHDNYIFSVAFHQIYPIMATCSWDNTIKLWPINVYDNDNYSWCKGITLYGHNDAVYGIAFHPFAPLIVSGSADNTIKIWKFNVTCTHSQCIMTLLEHIDTVHAISFHPKTFIMASCGADNTIKLWNVSNIVPFPYERFILVKKHLSKYLPIDIIEKILKNSFNMYGEKRITKHLLCRKW